ncbi:MAG: hypothetical protein HYR64_01275 [Fimbriimonas ginsengisoli]|uniref:Tetratricopeptide repeat protein n=1 Tax=Fimbriimonas ginsengisoli TaxID=1005039 RepID=A0A931LU37_FIMGI|nr:hypothetical protein [Fimbriimonas ginsengisoli]
MRKRPNWYAWLAIFLISQGALQRGFIQDRWARDFAPKGSLVKGTGLSPEQFLFALAGFREMVAGILWVRADSFFDSGNFDAVLPIIRLVTMLDPKQIDVYSTGMWHIGYNFTDEESRSDRRYVPSALALGKEGCKQNPDTYELWFETGWIWFHKIEDDYDKPVYYFEEAEKRPDMQPARKNLLAMAYQREGRADESLKQYFKLYDESAAEMKRDPSLATRQNMETLLQNIDTLLVRMSQRGYFAENNGTYASGEYDTKPPVDLGFSVKASIVEARVLRLEGTWNVLPVGTHIRVVLRDKDYPGGKVAEMDWDAQDEVTLDPPHDRTFMQDQLFVKNRRFSKRIDMSKDVTIYPFASKSYILELFYSPRLAPPHLQDKFSWNGEGMTDANYLNTVVRPGQRVIYASFELTRDQMLRFNQWADTMPILKTPNFRETTERGGREDVIEMPSLRTGG